MRRRQVGGTEEGCSGQSPEVRGAWSARGAEGSPMVAGAWCVRWGGGGERQAERELEDCSQTASQAMGGM